MVVLGSGGVYNCVLHGEEGYYDGQMSLNGNVLSIRNSGGSFQPVNACNVSGTVYQWLAIREVGA